MAEFHVGLTSNDMAAQIANMVNLYNRWATRFSAISILSSPARYYVELYGTEVVGCAAAVNEQPSLTKIQHICVLPNFQRRGIAKKLTKLAMDNCQTEYIYMTIREDNLASLSLARSLNFVYVNKMWFRDHYTTTWGRRKNGN